jgi:CHAT domain-containing protein
VLLCGALLCLASVGAIGGELAQSKPVSTAPEASQDRDKKSGNDRDTLAEWDATWVRVQEQPQSVSLSDHWRVCEIKYRFRTYRDLFKCLDLIEQRIALLASDAPQRQYGPLIINWMRSHAYAELGQEDAALTAANEAWELVPGAYREVSKAVWECSGTSVFSSCRPSTFQQVALEAGGTKFDEVNVSSGETTGFNNPAGLDLRPQTIVISLAAQRGVLYARRGDTATANSMLEYLDKWPKRSRYFFQPVMRQEPALQFTLGNYKAVVKAYSWVRLANRMDKFGRFMAGLNSALYLGVPTLADRVFSMRDSRRFASALEDAADEYLSATSLSRLGETAEAYKSFTHLLANPELRDMGSLYWAVLYEHSRVVAARGQRAEAIHLLQQATDAIERVRTTITFEAGKIGFAGSKQSVYSALVEALADSGDWRGAFEAAERAKARALVDLLAQRHDLPPPAAADEKVRALFASAQTTEASVGLVASEEAVRGIQIIAESRASLVQVAPEAASLVSVQKVPLEAISARIGRGETLIDYYSTGDDLFAFVLADNSVKGFKLSAKGLEEEVRAFRESIERRDPSVLARAQALDARLLEPLIQEIKGQQLTVSPHGSLHYLPFGALQHGDQSLIDRFSLRITPSAGALAYFRSDRPSKRGKLLALGNPDLGNPRYDLPNAQVEALSLAGMFPDSRALVRAEASKSAVKELGSGFSMLHFATHGRFNNDAPLNSGLYLAKGSESDGVLTVSDLYSLRWDVDLVTLSACETALGRVANGDDVIGLTRGFLYAGARSIVASLWEVDDAATEQLMVSFYKNLEAHTKREALRLAQIETRKSYPQPAFWAAFQIMGDAR